MARKKSKQAQNMKWSMYPELHDEVSELLEDDDLYFDFVNYEPSRGPIKTYVTNIMGKFICRNSTCGANGWSSKVIAIKIRMYTGAQYNAQVYHQRCKECESLSEPILDDSYAERVAYRIKKWCGVDVERPPYHGESKGPHESALCEGCRDNNCPWLKRS
ncbi:hypothetical protein CDD83_3546 [Cordyceps sp. RAO-2017]|nr:hypothetical protein CDD83_3546 [Cordyceps sp. RAO-2017]